MRVVLVIILVLAVAAGGTWVVAGRGGPPAIAIEKPDRFLGQRGTLEVVITAPGTLNHVEIQLEQAGRSTPLFSTTSPGTAEMKQEGGDRVRIVRPLSRRDVPGLKSGPARITVNATRTVLSGWRALASSASKDVQVRLEAPRASVTSTHHFVNHAGAEMVVYRTAPANVSSGVRVGDVSYPGYPLSGAAGASVDPAVKLAFFAITYDQDLGTPVSVVATDEAGNRTTAAVDVKPFPKPFRRSRIPVTDEFLRRVVPAILENTGDFTVENPDDLLQSFLKINGELRRQNAATIVELFKKTTPEMLWRGAFQQLGKSAVQSYFADHRTYVYQGREVDQQVHLGYDLAVTAAVPIAAANRGRVLYADYLGIYGNCVILDHGVGVGSLYAHLSSIDVKTGDTVQAGSTLGRSGMTGLAGGDHLHFTMLLQGIPVNAVEWWDAHWMEDRVNRKIREAVPGGAAQPTAMATP
jgi:murein DD-endopeptidase MepM/ murein hydrolase activator NlpD